MRYLALAITLLLSPAAFANDSVSITTQQARELYVALGALDGYEKIVKDGASEKVVKTPYTFGGGLRLALGRNILAVAPAVQSYDKASREIFLQFSNGKDKLEGEALAKFQGEVQKMQEVQTTFDVVKIKPSELKLDENPIPGSVIAALQPILTND